MINPNSCASLRLFALSLSLVLVLLPGWVGAQTPAPGSGERVPLLFGELKPGPHAVGYRVIHLKDSTRLVRPKRDYAGTVDATDRARQINLHLWYPAADTNAAPMTFEQYIYHGDFGALDDATRREQRDFVRRTQFPGRLSDDDWQRLLAAPLLARRNVRAAAGKFPLVLGELRPLSTSLTNEYLASHGYVVALVEGDNSSSALPPEDAYRDLEFAYAHTRTLPNVEPSVTGTLGFSALGVTQLLYAMRTREVDAVVCLESGFFHDRNLYEALKRKPGYDVTALRAPLLHAFRRGKEYSASLDDFETLRYATRYHYQVEAPQMLHSDFATEGMAASAVLGLRAEAAPLLRQAFALTNLYVLHFLNAYLKGDAAGLAFLRRDPTANGAPDKLIAITEKPGLKAAPSEAEFLSLIHKQGWERAQALFHEARKTDPDAILFREATLLQIGSRLSGKQRHQEAIAIYQLCFAAYPKSSQTAFNLGFAYEATGAKPLALEQFERSLQLVEGDPNQTESNRQFIKNVAPRRISALKAGANQ